MNSNRIELSVRQILTHLHDIEKIAPRKNFRIYIPSKIADSDVTQELLQKEAQKMMVFLGLTGFEYDVTYACTAEGVAGNCMNNGAEKSVHIQVSYDFMDNWASSVAVLAHEICHKVLFYYGLYKPEPFGDMNEVYAELATIYFGFGEIILAGYNKDGLSLGYLTAGTYRKINLLVCVVCGNIRSEVLGHLGIDSMTDRAVKLWESEEEKAKLLQDCFVKAEQQTAEYHKNILQAEKVLAQCKKDVLAEFELMDKTCFKDFSLHRSTPLQTFLFIYDNFCSKEYHSDMTESMNRVLCESLYTLYNTYQQYGDLELNNDSVSPQSGKSCEGKSNKVRYVMMECPNFHYTVDTQPWNVAALRYINDKKKEEEEITQRKCDKCTKCLDQKMLDKINAIRSDATNRIDDLKRNEHRRAKEEFFAKMPLLLRWIVSRYI